MRHTPLLCKASHEANDKIGKILFVLIGSNLISAYRFSLLPRALIPDKTKIIGNTRNFFSNFLTVSAYNPEVFKGHNYLMQIKK